MKLIFFVAMFSPAILGFELFKPITNPHLKKRVDFMMEIARNQPDLETYAKNRYGDFGPIALKKLHSLCEYYPSLIAFPGLIIEIENFEKFITDNHVKCGDPWQAAKQFSDSLGTTTVYRGINLNDEEFENVRENGIQSNAVRKNKKLEPYDNFSFPMELLRRARPDQVRLKPDLADRTLSLSSDPDISRTVSRAFASFKDVGKRYMYVFKIEIPKLENLFISANNSRLCQYSPRENEEFAPELMGEAGFIRNVLCQIGFFPEKIETFAEFLIEPDEVKEYEKVALTAESINEGRNQVDAIMQKHTCGNLDRIKEVVSRLKFFAYRALCWLFK